MWVTYIQLSIYLSIEDSKVGLKRDQLMMTSGTQAYGEPWYWDNRYSNEPGPFDWYQKYPTLAPIINLYVSRSHPILVVGSGNSGTHAPSSSLTSDLYISYLLHLKINVILRYPFLFFCFVHSIRFFYLQLSAKVWLMMVIRMLLTLIYLPWSLKLCRANTEIVPTWNVSFLLSWITI